MIALVLAAALAATVTPYEQELIAATNAARVAHGVKPLEADDKMMEYARKHNLAQGRRGMHHGSTPYSENVAAGQRDVPSVIRTWINSPGHRANMLSGRHTKMGVSGYTISGRTYWVQEFR
jgi:uncharacterized protein YkwD